MSNGRNGAYVSIAAGVGSGLGAAVAGITGDWTWMPIVLSGCLTLASIRYLTQSRTSGRTSVFFKKGSVGRSDQISKICALNGTICRRARKF